MFSPSPEDRCLPAPPLSLTGLEVQECPEGQIIPWGQRGSNMSYAVYTARRVSRTATQRPTREKHAPWRANVHTPAFQVNLVFPLCQAHRLFLGPLVYLLRPNLQHTHTHQNGIYKMPLYHKVTQWDLIRIDPCSLKLESIFNAI